MGLSAGKETDDDFLVSGMFHIQHLDSDGNTIDMRLPATLLQIVRQVQDQSLAGHITLAKSAIFTLEEMQEAGANGDSKMFQAHLAQALAHLIALAHTPGGLLPEVYGL
jgi:hypothetical protein